MKVWKKKINETLVVIQVYDEVAREVDLNLLFDSCVDSTAKRVFFTVYDDGTAGTRAEW